MIIDCMSHIPTQQKSYLSTDLAPKIQLNYYSANINVCIQCNAILFDTFILLIN